MKRLQVSFALLTRILRGDIAPLGPDAMPRDLRIHWVVGDNHGSGVIEIHASSREWAAEPEAPTMVAFAVRKRRGWKRRPQASQRRGTRRPRPAPPSLNGEPEAPAVSRGEVIAEQPASRDSRHVAGDGSTPSSAPAAAASPQSPPAAAIERRARLKALLRATRPRRTPAAPAIVDDTWRAETPVVRDVPVDREYRGPAKVRELRREASGERILEEAAKEIVKGSRWHRGARVVRVEKLQHRGRKVGGTCLRVYFRELSHSGRLRYLDASQFLRTSRPQHPDSPAEERTA